MSSTHTSNPTQAEQWAVIIENNDSQVNRE